MVSLGSGALELQQWKNTLETTGLYETAVALAHMTISFFGSHILGLWT
jgi:hypothetical protein